MLYLLQNGLLVNDFLKLNYSWKMNYRLSFASVAAFSAASFLSSKITRLDDCKFFVSFDKRLSCFIHTEESATSSWKWSVPKWTCILGSLEALCE